MPKGRVPPVPYRKFLTNVAIGQAVVAVGLSPLLPLSAVAQQVAQTPTPAPTAGSTSSSSPSLNLPTTGQSNIILPTDVLPLTAGQDRVPLGENLLLRINQYLPSRFYFSASCETSLRYETNPFQFPKKSILVRQLPGPVQINNLPLNQQLALKQIVQHSDSEDTVFRILPNVTGGWTLTPRTRLFGNYFMIRDQLAKNVTLNTMIHSYAFGLQQDIPLGSRANLQAEMQFRELNQWHQQSVFDFLPGLTVSYIANPKTVLFVNALLQMRGKKYFQGPTKELDPFYTFGGLHTRGGWTFAASTTIVQNFREPFRKNATIPVNNYAIISDFEVARRLFKQIPGLQAFVRAEPIFNFHSNNRPGLAGIDFRLFYGLRMAVAKPALTNTINNIIEQLRNQEKEPGPGGKPSATLPDNVIAGLQQPIHGGMEDDGDTEAVKVDPPSPVVAAANSIAEAESVGSGTTGGADNAATADNTAAPVELERADWKPIVTKLPDERDFTLSEIHEEIADSAAQSTIAEYDTTAKRAELIATRPVVAPKVEIAAANWNSVLAAAHKVDTAIMQVDQIDRGLIEAAASASTTDGARYTDKRVNAIAHALPPPTPVTPTPKLHTAIAQQPPPKPITTVIPQLANHAPVAPAPSRISAAPPIADNKPLTVAAVNSPAPMTKPTAAVSKHVSLPEPTLSATAPVPPHTVAPGPQRIALSKPLDSVLPVAPQPPQQTMAPKAPEPASIPTAPTLMAPKPVAVATAGAAAPHTVPAPIKAETKRDELPAVSAVIRPKQDVSDMVAMASMPDAVLLELPKQPVSDIVAMATMPDAVKLVEEAKPAVAKQPLADVVAMASMPDAVKLEVPKHPVSDMVAMVTMPDAVKLEVKPIEVQSRPQIDLAAAANWDSIAKLGERRTLLSWQYLGELRTAVDNAANESARVMDYAVMPKRERVQIAAKVAKPPTNTKPAEQPAPHAVLMIPMKGDMSAPSITSDRPGEEEQRSRGWHTMPSKSGHEAAMPMRIVPPLPTVRPRDLRDKHNPFKNAGIDLKKPLMLSIPH